jgi:small conductance mechanosensitive channel
MLSNDRGPITVRNAVSRCLLAALVGARLQIRSKDSQAFGAPPKTAMRQEVHSRTVATRLQGARDRRLGWGGRFWAETRGSGEAAFGRLIESVGRIIPRVLAAGVVIALFWLLARGVRGVLRLVFRRAVEDITVESLIKQLTYYAIITLGFFVAVDALGFDPTTVAAGLGLSGIVLGFALKDILSNFVSGLLLLTLRPFRIGDQIVVGDLEGSVEKIELRATRLRAYDDRVMLVPNAEVFTQRIVNNTADPLRREAVTLWLGYDVDVANAMALITRATARAPGVLDQPAPVVRIDELGQDDIRMEVTFWADSQRSDYKNTAAAVRVSILDGLAEANIPLPDPAARNVRLQADGGDQQNGPNP